MMLWLAMSLFQAIESPRGQEIVVTKALDEAASARRFIDRISPPLTGTAPLARFSDTVCVGSAGLPVAAGQTVVDRVSEIAASVGLRVAEPGCAPNVLVLFVEDSRASVRRLASAGSPGIKSQSIADVRRIVAEPGRARAWIEVETRSRDGDRPSYMPNEPTTLSVATSSRMSSAVRRDVLSATVVIDRDAMAGRDLRQVADYAAMRALTGARLRASFEGNSILALFTPEGDAGAPRALTEYDRGYLRGLYAGRGDIDPRMKKQGMVAHMIRERAGTGPALP